jgi:hypothetical protein
VLIGSSYGVIICNIQNKLSVCRLLWAFCVCFRSYTFTDGVCVLLSGVKFVEYLEYGVICVDVLIICKLSLLIL